jgi:hypothetical protein
MSKKLRRSDKILFTTGAIGIGVMIFGLYQTKIALRNEPETSRPKANYELVSEVGSVLAFVSGITGLTLKRRREADIVVIIRD